MREKAGKRRGSRNVTCSHFALFFYRLDEHLVETDEMVSLLPFFSQQLLGFGQFHYIARSRKCKVIFKFNFILKNCKKKKKNYYYLKVVGVFQ